MTKVFIAGVGMTRMGKLLDRSIKSLTADAVGEALDDAGVAAAEIQSAYFSNATQGHMEGQDMIRGQIALRDMGIEQIPVVNVENACASGATAFNLAVQFLKAGEGDVSLAVGAEKMYSKDRARMFSAFDGAWDVAEVEANQANLLALGEGYEVPPGTTSDKPYSLFMDVYAAWSRFHMKQFGTTQRQIAAVSAKNHNHSQYNDRAQYRMPYTVDEILAAPPITYPLTLPMCAPISDGGAAAILCTEDGLKRLGLDRARAVEVKASILQTGSNRVVTDMAEHVTAKAARRAYERAGVGPEDVSVAEVHDATAMGEIVQIENLGFCDFGDGGATSERGDTTLGGRVPVNPSGGLECKGHPIGATGLCQIQELTTQLRGEAGERQVEDARIGLAENGGGLYGIEESVASVVILGI
ncbi:MAG: thiolase family protein [Rhodospirillaceae bacterium]|jgi:acetyl-CoA acetyltransferase|nr:thiolase family protein [Rhodospirillaceae bacterium]MBT4044630.1 thiolase family protein [Rhodospirillaceae bacterium]MBT4688322.1 thiolase family protein [Rhodospirillaceae bacterium]MBT5080034.1 thiolase family protein [Rhodospirillaceae bacterium]MBT5525623.1 thiolase family protein [Rhodospirillaceae bacterium]